MEGSARDEADRAAAIVSVVGAGASVAYLLNEEERARRSGKSGGLEPGFLQRRKSSWQNNVGATR
jgi:hypothetical protein